MRISKLQVLDKPVALREHNWPRNVAPVVSILCATYNHVEYIQECIEGFLDQETRFPVEILIRDDASTDGTADIVRSYAERYPTLVKAILEKENTCSKGVRPSVCLMKDARGEFLALCEGDDYWLRRDKLELQVALLKDCPDVSLVFSDREVIGGEESAFRSYPKEIYKFRDVLEGFVPFTQTIVMRNYAELPAFLNSHIEFNGDQLVGLFCGFHGSMRKLSIRSACYRRTGKGVWSSESKRERNIKILHSRIKLNEIFGVGPSLSLAASLKPLVVALIGSTSNWSERRRIVSIYRKCAGGSLLEILYESIKIPVYQTGSRMKRILQRI
jgi:glycosyltransferase involved in cell wall biosynthesis